MVETNICDQDLLVIDRLRDYGHGQIALAFVDGQRLIRRLEKLEGRLFLFPTHNRCREIELDEEAQIFGRVSHSVTHLGRSSF
jgi:SOS-response transcriptional repressor LexA